MDINKIIAWALAAAMSGAAGKMWSDLEIEISISKSKDEAITSALKLWDDERSK